MSLPVGLDCLESDISSRWHCRRPTLQPSQPGVQISSCGLRQCHRGDMWPIFNCRTKSTLPCYRRSAAPKHPPPENFAVGQCFIRQLLLKSPPKFSSKLDRKSVDGSGVDRQSERNWTGHECSQYDSKNDRHGMQLISAGQLSLWELVSNVPWISTKSKYDNWRDWDWTGFHVCDRTVDACRAYPGNASLLEQRKAKQQTKKVAWIPECDAALAGSRTHSKKKKKGRIMLRPGGPKDCGFFGTKT